ncbi:nucleotide-diphospho-sugar transferase [Clavulina sp. PMI_390]|nr:nucleotide-diphospho-sugar transferase [Clavulina sp. PMI_390]
MSTYESELKRYEAAGQGHVFAFWDRLNEQDRAKLLASTSSIDIARATRVFKLSTAPPSDEPEEPVGPLPEEVFESTIGAAAEAHVHEWRKIGLDAIGRNQVGVLLMAGGQGTRLGSSDPKGCYDIGLPSHKPLFQIQAERITRLQALGKPKGSVVIPWYVMTSGPTRPATEAFFAKHNFFGLDKANVIFFEQGTLPCFTFDGKVILSSPSEIATAPDGNGGLYAALRAPLSPSSKDSVLTDLAKRKITYIHAHAVDNCLVKVADPIFVGYSIAKQADCAAKVVPKLSPHESVGVVARKGKVFSVVEYSEITKAQAELKDASGQLAFRAANIVNHLFTLNFLENVEEHEKLLAFHIAKKKIPFIEIPSSSTTTSSSTPLPTVTKPTSPNGIKLELFVFDVFPFAKQMVVLEVPRAEEFSPLKNAPGTGSDDPETSRRDLIAQGTRYLEAVGATVEGEDTVVELSPLVTYAGEGLESVKGKVFKRSGYVGAVEEFDALA